MSAYLITLISGNESFGGYLSVDGATAFPIENDMTYEIKPGVHSIVIYSTSNFDRAKGSAQATVYSNTSSSGRIFDAIEAGIAMKNLGDKWEMSINVEENQLLALNVTSSGKKIVATPMYEVSNLTDDEVKQLEKTFEEYRSTPRRNPKQMVWGAILAAVGAFGMFNFIRIGGDAKAAIILGAILGIGVLLFVLGFMKRIRK